MKNVLLNVAALAALSAVSTATVADNMGKMYAGGQYALVSYNEQGVEELNPTALVGRFGKEFNEYFALEGRLGIGLQDDSLNFLGTDISFDIDSLLGIYGVGHLDINEMFSVYGLVGFTSAKATVSFLGYSESSSESGLSFGVGIDMGIGNNVTLNIEYVQYLNKSDFDFSAIGLGAFYSF